MNRYDNFNPEIIDSDITYNEINDEKDIINTDTNRNENKKGEQALKGNSKRKKKKNITQRPDKKESLIERCRLFVSNPTFKRLMGLAMGLCGIYLFISFISFISNGYSDQSSVENTIIGSNPPVNNITGEGGARISNFLINDYFGLGAVVIAFWMVSICLKQFGFIRFKIVNYTIKCVVALITLSLIVGLLTIGLDSHFNWGGNHGRYVNEFIINFFGWTGAVLICIFLISVFFIICLNDLRVWILKIKRERDLKRAEIQAAIDAEEEEKRKINSMSKLDEDTNNIESEENSVTESYDDHLNFSDTQNNELESSQNEENLTYIYKDPENDSDNNIVTEEAGESVMKVNVNEIDTIEDEENQTSVYDPTAELSRYQFPSYSLLNDSKVKISIDKSEQLENQDKIRKTLLDFGIPITSIEATVGPTVTLYEIVPDKGVKISKIKSLVDDIALSLSAIGVRIIAPIPGKGTVGIEVANKDPQTVSMRTVITSKKYQESKYELPIAIGSTISNEVYIADLAKMPHLLVAGATGQGKSVGLNAIITSLLYRKHPAELKFVLIDPKMVEFSLYASLEKHYLAKLPDEEEPIITDPHKAVPTLSSLCVEMDDRYTLLKDAATRNIKDYNAKFITKVLNPEKGHRYLPYIVVIVDEFSDLIMTSGKEIELPIARIAQKARAVGIHMILATQRPSTNVITGIIRANFPARMAFKVSSGVDSKIILDTTGAQQLIGRGDMLLSTNSEIERVQCAFIDTPEVESICKFISKQPGYSNAYLLPEPLIDADSNGYANDNASFSDRDPLFDEIARSIVNSNTASTSSLQRRYSIGYNRAGKIMDQMEAAGIVGPSQGGKPRVVLVDPITLESILNN